MSECSVLECDRPVKTAGLCGTHYDRKRRGVADWDAAILLRGARLKLDLCTVDGCSRQCTSQFSSYCVTHKSRRYRGSPIDAPVRLAKSLPGDCPRCRRYTEKFRRGMCRHCYNAARAAGQMPNLYNTEPKPYRSKSGYLIASVDGRKVPEHRLIMEMHLGRPLWPDENVHHINGVRDDNRIENLELWSTRQPSGQRIEDKVTFALEILARYAPHHLATKAVA